MTHGEGTARDTAAALPVFLGGDPYLAHVLADMSAYRAAHPCECEAHCECDLQRLSRRRDGESEHEPEDEVAP